jgi:hypothetical protein
MKNPALLHGSLKWILLYANLLLSCSSDGDLAPYRILHTWTVGDSGTLTHNGRDLTLQYKKLELDFNSTHGFDLNKPGLYSTNADFILTPTGQWIWMGTQLKQLSLDDGAILMNVTVLETTKLHLVFTLDKSYFKDHPELDSLAGSYDISLIRIIQP